MIHIFKAVSGFILRFKRDGLSCKGRKGNRAIPGNQTGICQVTAIGWDGVKGDADFSGIEKNCIPDHLSCFGSIAVHRVAFPADTKELVGSPDRTFLSSKCHKIGISADDFQMLGIFTKANPGVATDIKG